MRRREFIRAASGLLVPRLSGQILQPILSGSGLNPPTGPLARYKASSLALSDGAAVASWPDLTGNGYTATQSNSANRPVYKSSASIAGKPSVWFSPNTYPGVGSNINAYLPIPTLPGSSYPASVFVIGEYFIIGTSMAALWGSGSTALGVYGDKKPSTHLGQTVFSVNSGIQTGIYTPMGPICFGLTSSSSGCVAYCGGQTYSRAALTLNSYTNAVIGGYSTTSFSYGWCGHIFEVLYYNRVLSTAEVAALQAYAAAAYGTQSTYTEQVVCVGDSITQGTGSSYGATYPSKLSGKIAKGGKPGVRVLDFGVSGQLLQTISSDQSEIGAVYSASYSKNIAVVWAGTNDIVSSMADAPTTYGYFTSLCSYLRSTGYKIVAVTMLPRGSAYETTRQSYNSLIKGTPSIYDVLADVASDPNIGQAGQNGNSYYYDVTHPNDAGYNIAVNSYIYPAVASLL